MTDTTSPSTKIPNNPESDSSTSPTAEPPSAPPQIQFQHNHSQTPHFIYNVAIHPNHTQQYLNPSQLLKKQYYATCVIGGKQLFIHGGAKKKGSPASKSALMLNLEDMTLTQLKIKNFPALSHHFCQYVPSTDSIVMLAQKEYAMYFLRNVSKQRHLEWQKVPFLHNQNIHSLDDPKNDNFEWLPVAYFSSRVSYRWYTHEEFLSFIYVDGKSLPVIVSCRSESPRRVHLIDYAYFVYGGSEPVARLQTIDQEGIPGKIESTCIASDVVYAMVRNEKGDSSATSSHSYWKFDTKNLFTDSHEFHCEKLDVVAPPEVSGCSLVPAKRFKGFYLIGGEVLPEEKRDSSVKKKRSVLAMVQQQQQKSSLSSEPTPAPLYAYNEDTSTFSVLLPNQHTSQKIAVKNPHIVSVSGSAHLVFGGTQLSNGSANQEFYVLRNLNRSAEDSSNGIAVSKYLSSVLKSQNPPCQDCTLITKDGPIRAHKCILAARSPVLAELLYYSEENMEIDLFEDCSLDSVRALLDFMYTCQFKIEKKDYVDFLNALDITQLKQDVSPLFESLQRSVTLRLHEKLFTKYLSDLKSLVSDDRGVSDILLEVHPSETLFNVHKLILIQEDHFQRMLSMDMMESMIGTIRVEDVSEECARVLLEYIYTGFGTFSDSNVVEVYIAAAMLVMKKLRDMCAAYIYEYMNMDTASDILAVAVAGGDDQLLQRCISQIANSMEGLELSEEFNDLPAHVRSKLEDERGKAYLKQIRQKKKSHLL